MRFQDPKIEQHGTKKKVWRIRPVVVVRQPDGSFLRKRKPIILGQIKDMTREEAKIAKQKVMATVNAGRLVVQSQLPFSEIVRQYKLGRLPHLAASTRSKYSSHIEKHIQTAFNDLSIREIDRATVQIWLNEKSKSLSYATLLDLKNVLSAIFSQARDWKLWDGQNPTEGVKVGRKRDAREKRLLTPEQFVAFLAAIPDTCILPAPKVRLMVMAAIAGAMRVSEVLGLQGRDIDVARGAVMVWRRWHRGDVDVPKSQASEVERYVGAELSRDLAELAEGEAWLFARPDTGEPPDDRDLQQHVFRPAAEAAGCYFAGFGMHTFKRMSVTLRQRAGATPLEAMVRAGHADLRTTMRYTIVDRYREAEILTGMLKMVGMGSEGVKQ